ncbi:MAG: hypothetical protein RL213_1909 [Bacteroidota bacterium]
MRPPVLLLILLQVTAAFGQYASQDIALMSRFDDPAVTAEPVYGIRYQGCWGWTDPSDGREYGIIGSTAGTYIVEVTDPYQPVVRDYVAGLSQDRIWHEYKTYHNYLYIISDGGGNTLQIADLSYLPDSVHVVYDSNVIFDSGHTLYVDSNLLYVASVSKPTVPRSSMNVYSLANPVYPQLLRRLDTDYPAINNVHDMYVHNDTVFASCGYDGLHIFKFNRATGHFQQLGSLTTYPDAGYNHSSFASRDHSVLYMCDEVPDGMAVKVIDITDLSSPTVVDTFATNGLATPHNPYVIGDELYIAYYQDGVQAYDISQPQTPVPDGYFDTHYQNPTGTYPSPAYQGCWGVYTDLPSGHLLASDTQLGLFVLDISTLTASGESDPVKDVLTVYPNPASDAVSVRLPFAQSPGRLDLTDPMGRSVLSMTTSDGQSSQRINTSALPEGIYFLRYRNRTEEMSRTLLITR